MITTQDILQKIINEAKEDKQELREFKDNQLQANLTQAENQVKHAQDHVELCQIVNEVAEQQQETQRQLKVLQADYLEQQSLNDDPFEEAAAEKSAIVLENVVKLIDEANKPFVEQLKELKADNERLEQRMKLYHNVFGACLRKINAAIENDPSNAYLKKVLEAIEDVSSKLD